MKNTAMLLALAACGTNEGSELPYRIPPCDIPDQATVTDATAPHYDLAPLDELLAPMLGTIEVHAVLLDDASSTIYPGTLTVTSSGAPVLARDQEWPDSLQEPGVNQNCEDDYLVGVEAELRLDDGIFSVSGPLTLSVQNGPFSWVDLEESPMWWDIATASGSLALLGEQGEIPEDVILNLDYVDDRWTGSTSLRGTGPTTHSAWILLTFDEVVAR